MTSAEWLESEQEKAMMIDPERLHVILDKPEYFVAILLSMADGFRAVMSNCLAVQGMIPEEYR